MVIVNGTLYAAGQAEDRVYAVDGASARTVLQLTPVPGQDGVDGIAATGGQLLVPDSPRGVLHWVDTGGHITRSVGGFTRPTGVWPLGDGAVLVADEFGNAVVRVNPDGSKTYLARNLPIADDVAADPQGAVFAVLPVATGGRLVQIDNGSARDVATRLQAPQGVTFDDASNVVISEEDAGRVDLLIRTFKIVPLSSTRPAAGRSLCIDLARGPGFSDAVTLSGDSGLQIVKQPGTGAQGEVVLRGCSRDPCRLTASSGSLTDYIWIAAG
jgi:DNA-binding beta-propeller fold protein YncE